MSNHGSIYRNDVRAFLKRTKINGLSPEVYCELVYLGTYLDENNVFRIEFSPDKTFESNMMFYMEMERVKQYERFIAETMGKIIDYRDGKLFLLDEDILENFYGEFYLYDLKCMEIVCYLYESVSSTHRKDLGVIFQLLPYIDFSDTEISKEGIKVKLQSLKTSDFYMILPQAGYGLDKIEIMQELIKYISICEPKEMKI